MGNELRVVIEEAPKGKRWVAIAADWPGLERNGKSEADAIAKLESYRPRYLKVAQRAGLGTDFERESKPTVVAHHTGTGSTDFWGISFAPSDEDHEPVDEKTFERRLALLHAAWAEFDEVAARVSEELRPGVRGGGRSRDAIIRHVLVVEGSDFSKRVGQETDFEDPANRTPAHRAVHRDRFVDAMRGWRVENKPIGRTWTLSYLLRHSAYHVLDHTWEMEDRDQT
jgi:predicted RNase H-like HicB family nuclease